MSAPTEASAAAAQNFLVEASGWRRGVLHYGAAALVVAAMFATLAVVFGRTSVTGAVSDVDAAIMIDLPPETSARRGSETEEAPSQQAAQAAPPQPTPEPPKPVETPVPEKALDAPHDPVPEARSDAPVAREEARQPEKPPETPAATSPPQAAQEAQAPAGAEAPVQTEAEDGGEATPHASARAITQWQKSLMHRLEHSKRAFAAAARFSGTVRIAFEIDTHGGLVSERIAQSSGSPALDGAAEALVHKAAPFPPPPAGAGHKEMSFIVPIRFRH